MRRDKPRRDSYQWIIPQVDEAAMFAFPGGSMRRSIEPIGNEPIQVNVRQRISANSEQNA